MSNPTYSVLLALALICAAFLPAESRSFKARGASGALGGFHRQGQYGSGAGVGGIRYGKGAGGLIGGKFNTPYGGTFKGAGGGFATSQAGGFAGKFQGTTGQGGNYAGQGIGAWKKGVGGFQQTQFNATAANGNNYAGYTKGMYNAQTGQGSFDSGKQYTNATTGQQYGYNQQSDWTKGQGGTTTLDTQNKGDYSIDWQKGEKPVITPVNTSQ